MNGRLHLPREIDALDRCPDRRRRLELARLDVEVADTVRGVMNVCPAASVNTTIASATAIFSTGSR
jgi:hypothetical protein